MILLILGLGWALYFGIHQIMVVVNTITAIIQKAQLCILKKAGSILLKEKIAGIAVVFTARQFFQKDPGYLSVKKSGGAKIKV